MTTIGLIGAGHIGSALAHGAVAAGYSVVVSNSRGPHTLVDLVAELGDSARAGTAWEAAAEGDVVVVTIPLHAHRDVPAEPLAGKVVVDTTNYHPQRDGHIAALDDGATTSSELLADHLGTARVVKAFNHISAADLAGQGVEGGTPGRRALALAGDDEEAKAQVAAFVDALGFDVVDAGGLAEGRWIEPGTPGYGPRLDRRELEQALDAARPQVPVTA